MPFFVNLPQFQGHGRPPCTMVEIDRIFGIFGVPHSKMRTNQLKEVFYRYLMLKITLNKTFIMKRTIQVGLDPVGGHILSYLYFRMTVLWQQSYFLVKFFKFHRVQSWSSRTLWVATSPPCGWPHPDPVGGYIPTMWVSTSGPFWSSSFRSSLEYILLQNSLL